MEKRSIAATHDRGDEAQGQESTSQNHLKHSYITGIKGILVIESFVWVYLNTFIPAVTAGTEEGPLYQHVIRWLFGVLLWNRSLISSFFILLSMRNICVRFLSDPSGRNYAKTVIQRIVHLDITVCAGLGLAVLIFSQIGTDFIREFKNQLPNESIQPPVKVPSALAAFNSMFDFFWITQDFYSQAANNFWPTSTIWVPSIIYYQSFTVYFLMVILPFTRPEGHIKWLALFALGSFWIESWGWYSATGLFLADLALNRALKTKFHSGLPLPGDRRIPYWVFGIIMTAVGFALKETFIVLPQFSDSELYLHPYLSLSQTYSVHQLMGKPGAWPRLDDWFCVTGILILAERFEKPKEILSSKLLVWLGKRSFSFFVAQSIIFWTAGIKLWLFLRSQAKLDTASTNTVVLVPCFAAVMILAELFHRCVDQPSVWLASKTFQWLTI